jgi:hypothetical protein
MGGERSLAEACLNGEVAPIFAISGTPIGRPKSTSSGHLDAADTRTVWQTKNPEPVGLRDPTAGRSSPIRVRNNRGSAALARYRSPGGNVLQRRVRPTRPFPKCAERWYWPHRETWCTARPASADHRCSHADRVANADCVPAAASDLDLSALLSVLVRHNALENDGLRVGVGTDLVDLV